MSSQQPDTFGQPGAQGVVTDPATGIAYVLGFDDSTVPPGVVWRAATTWALAKNRWATWGAAKAQAGSWGIAKALLVS